MPLVSCSGYHLFLLCHPDCLITMSPVSMALHVSYMRSLCTKEWRTGRQMIFSAVRHGVAKEFIKVCAGLRVNKRCRITLDRIRKVLARKQWLPWMTNFSKEAYYVLLGMRRMALPQAAVPSGQSTIAFMRADSRKLVHAGLTKPSRLSIADHGALQFRKLWRSIIRRDIVVWGDNWWHAQFRANPVKPNVCLDVTAIAVLHTTPVSHSLGHPSVRDQVDPGGHSGHGSCSTARRNVEAVHPYAQYTHLSENHPCPPRCSPEAGRRQLICKLFGINESGTGQNQELLDLLDMLRSTPRHCQNPMALLVDCNIHYRVLKFLYSRAPVDWNFPARLWGMSLIYGVWHPYKHVCNIIWHELFPLFSYITAPVFGAGAHIYNQPTLIVIEKTIAALLLAAPDIRAQLRQKITLFEGRANRAALNTQMGCASFGALNPS